MKTFLKALLIIALFYFIINRPLIFDAQEMIYAFSSERKDLIKDDSHITGIDVSYDQGQINWKQVSKSGIKFVYHKASDGITYQDPMFNKNAKEINKYDFPFGAYHFFEPKDDALLQADNFLTTIKNKNLNLAPMVDVEITENQKPELIKKSLKIFLDRIEEKTGCKALIYSYGDFWKNNIGKNFNDYVFWLADYSKKLEEVENLKNVQIWQHSQKGRVSGIRTYVDLDLILKGQKGLDKIKCTYKVGDK